jgi:hypothetical protein
MMGERWKEEGERWKVDRGGENLIVPEGRELLKLFKPVKLFS